MSMSSSSPISLRRPKRLLLARLLMRFGLRELQSGWFLHAFLRELEQLPLSLVKILTLVLSEHLLRSMNISPLLKVLCGALIPMISGALNLVNSLQSRFSLQSTTMKSWQNKTLLLSLLLRSIVKTEGNCIVAYFIGYIKDNKTNERSLKHV